MIKVVVDIREKKLIKLLQALHKDYELKIEIEIDTLDLGDIIIYKNDEEKMIIERKSLSDLASSIKDGRYQEQSFRLTNYDLHNHNIVYLIEGNLDRYSSRYTRIKKETLLVTMFCIQYYKGFSVMRTNTIVETAEYILRIADKLLREKRRENYYQNTENEKIKNNDSDKTYTDVVTKVKKNNIRPDNIGEIILSQIPGISSKTSKAIMSHYKSLYHLLDCISKDKHHMDGIMMETKNNQQRKLSQSSINSIIKYLLYQKDEPVIKIDI